MIANLWESIEDIKVKCELCSHHCIIEQGNMGRCGVRINKDGEMHTLVANNVAALNIDPVEKKPLYHFFPGTNTYSLGTEGCNMACSFCQNHALSQNPKITGEVHGKYINAKSLVDNAISTNSHSISFTYSEPTIFFELMYETAQIARVHNINTILVSNGYQSQKCLESLSKLIDAANIDLKSFSDGFYRKFCKASLAPVLNNLKTIKNMGWWLEVTTLLIPSINDSKEELQDIASFICSELGPEVPWHISRFHGAYELHEHSATPLNSLILAKEYGEAQGLKHVYICNVAHGEHSCTFCPLCKRKCIMRNGYMVSNSIVDGLCPYCGYKLAGVW